MTSQVNIFQSANNIEIEINYVTVMKYALNTEFKKIGGRWNKDLKVRVFEKKCSTVLNHLFDSKNLKTTIIKQNKRCLEKDYDAAENVTLQKNKLLDTRFVGKDAEEVHVSINYSNKECEVFSNDELIINYLYLQVFITLSMTGNQTALSLRQQKWTKCWFK